MTSNGSDLNGSVCVVTGGGSGIGAALCRALVAAGAEAVAVVDRNREGAEAVAASLGGRTPVPVWEQQWQVNVMAHVYAVRAALPSMLERGSGIIQHTASMAGILTSHGACTYATTKHAVVGLAEWLSISYHDRGIRVHLLAPLGVDTPMLDTSSDFARNAAGPIRTADEVAGQVLDAFRDGRFLVLTDPVAQTWMERKTADIERWLTGMRRLQARIFPGHR